MKYLIQRKYSRLSENVPYFIDTNSVPDTLLDYVTHNNLYFGRTVERSLDNLEIIINNYWMSEEDYLTFKHWKNNLPESDEISQYFKNHDSYNIENNIQQYISYDVVEDPILN
jgi:hypothetical protein